MSWGYICKLVAKIPQDKWEAWQQLTPSKFALPADWPSAELVSYFKPQTPADDTFKACLGYDSWEPAPSIEQGETVEVKLVTVLDRSLLHVAGVLPALLRGAHEVGGQGSLLICSDGSAEEAGWQCTVAGGDRLESTPLSTDEMWRHIDELSAELGV
jgi:hypothetical protein